MTSFTGRDAHDADGPSRIVPRLGHGFGPAHSAPFEEVIDPVQSEKSRDDQIDRHREAHDPRCDQQKHSRGQANNRHEGIGSIEVHRGTIPDSDAASAAHIDSPVRWRRSTRRFNRQRLAAHARRLRW